MKDYHRDVSFWGPEGVERNCDPTKWPQNRFPSDSGDEVWRLDEAGRRKYLGSRLCAVCCTIDFRVLFDHDYKLKDNHDEVPIGYLDEIMEKQSCPFCQLVIATLQEYTGSAVVPTVVDGRRVKCDLRRKYLDAEQSRHDGDFLFHAIRLAAVPLPPSWTTARQSVVNKSPMRFNCRPLNTESPMSMKSDDPLVIEMRIWTASDDEDPLGQYPAQIIQPWIDFAKLRTWLDKCRCLRDTLIKDQPLPQRFRLVDVIRDCLVEGLPSEIGFVALSYVWGRAQQATLMTQQSNVAQLMMAGGICNSGKHVARTISDAMAVVKCLGLRYLWVDSLCIIQDDLKDVSEQIRAMGDIYAAASMTIVAAAGSNAEAGLPGVHSTPRRGQCVVNVQGLTLVNKLFGPGETLDASHYNSRAWTYQERLLSRCMLIFSSAQVHIRCIPCQRTECEDIASEHGFHTANPFDSVAVGVRTSHNLYDYESCVFNYTSRNLSFDADAQNAFAGIETLLRPMLRSDFVLALPKVYFDMALLWHADASRCRRRQSDNGTVMFPSWSWLSLSGPISFDYMYKLSSRMLYLNGTAPNSSPHHFCAEDLMPHADWSDWEKWERTENGMFWSSSAYPKTHWRHPVLHESERPEFGYCGSSAMYLDFQTQVVWLQLSDGPLPPTFAPDNYFDMSSKTGIWKRIVLNDGNVCGVIHMDVVPTFSVDTRQPLILLSRTAKERHVISGPEEYMFAPRGGSRTATWDQDQFDFDAEYARAGSGQLSETDWSIYNVMLLDTLDGISTRQGIGTMWLHAFHESQPYRCRITLG